MSGAKREGPRCGYPSDYYSAPTDGPWPPKEKPANWGPEGRLVEHETKEQFRERLREYGTAMLVDMLINAIFAMEQQDKLKLSSPEAGEEQPVGG